MACSTQINAGINARCDTSMGGIVEVAIANYVEGIFTETTDKQKVTVEDDSVAWYKFSFRKGTSQMTSTLNIDDANGINYVSTELQMLFGRMDTDKRLAIAALAQAEMVAIVKDCNGKYWALGMTEPVTANGGEGATGQARGDSNHYSITLLDTHTTFPMEVENGAEIMEAAQN